MLRDSDAVLDWIGLGTEAFEFDLPMMRACCENSYQISHDGSFEVPDRIQHVLENRFAPLAIHATQTRMNEGSRTLLGTAPGMEFVWVSHYLGWRRPWTSVFAKECGETKRPDSLGNKCWGDVAGTSSTS